MIAFRSVFSLLLLAPFLRVGDFRDALRSSSPSLHLLRMTMSALEMTCFFFAVSVLPLADASTLYLAVPIYVTAMSPFLLGERVGWRRWVAVIVGFAGVLIALQPTREVISPAAMIAVAGAIMFSLVVVTTRKLRGASNTVLIALQLLAALVVSLVLANGSWTAPRWADLAVLLFGSVISVTGYAAFNQSLRVAPASVVTPFQYTSLIWAALFGYFLFDEVPSPATWIGAAVIVGAGLFIFWRERTKLGRA
jgi:S-adenosylmethionine uptake transporter